MDGCCDECIYFTGNSCQLTGQAKGPYNCCKFYIKD